MTAQEICKYIDNILSSGESISKEEIEKIISWLYKIIQNQNNTMADLKNSCIRLQNNISMVEDKISQYSVYKELCENILNRINANPITALLFLYKVKRKIEEYNKII